MPTIWAVCGKVARLSRPSEKRLPDPARARLPQTPPLVGQTFRKRATASAKRPHTRGLQGAAPARRTATASMHRPRQPRDAADADEPGRHGHVTVDTAKDLAEHAFTAGPALPQRSANAGSPRSKAGSTWPRLSALRASHSPIATAHRFTAFRMNRAGLLGHTLVMPATRRGDRQPTRRSHLSGTPQNEDRRALRSWCVWACTVRKSAHRASI